jgi:hypothetical protein
MNLIYFKPNILILKTYLFILTGNKLTTTKEAEKEATTEAKCFLFGIFTK